MTVSASTSTVSTQLISACNGERSNRDPTKSDIPAPQYPLQRSPSRPALRGVYHDVIVVTHHRLGGHVDGKQINKRLNVLGDPVKVVIEVQAENWFSLHKKM